MNTSRLNACIYRVCQEALWTVAVILRDWLGWNSLGSGSGVVTVDPVARDHEKREDGNLQPRVSGTTAHARNEEIVSEEEDSGSIARHHPHLRRTQLKPTSSLPSSLSPINGLSSREHQPDNQTSSPITTSYEYPYTQIDGKQIEHHERRISPISRPRC